MRCHYLSDLHLETQDFPWTLPGGDVLIVAGDTCHACCLDPATLDRPSVEQRDRVQRFADDAVRRYAHVLLIAGNHEHYGGIVEDTTRLLKVGLPGVVILDDTSIEIGGVLFHGTTLWSSFEPRSPAGFDAMRKRMGEYFFARTRRSSEAVRKFQPEDAARLFDASWQTLRGAIVSRNGRPMVVITHHAPSLRGLNPFHSGNALDAAYASDLDTEIARLDGVRYWVHGHTHIQRRYRIGETNVVTNARGFERRDQGATRFTPAAHFDL